MRFVKPLDEELILQLVKSHEALITLEENTLLGGAGSAVNEFLAANNLKVTIKNIGIPDRFIQHGNTLDLKAEIALNQDGIIQAGMDLLGS